MIIEKSVKESAQNAQKTCYYKKIKVRGFDLKITTDSLLVEGFNLNYKSFIE